MMLAHALFTSNYTFCLQSSQLSISTSSVGRIWVYNYELHYFLEGVFGIALTFQKSISLVKDLIHLRHHKAALLQANARTLGFLINILAHYNSISYYNSYYLLATSPSTSTQLTFYSNCFCLLPVSYPFHFLLCYTSWTLAIQLSLSLSLSVYHQACFFAHFAMPAPYLIIKQFIYFWSRSYSYHWAYFLWLTSFCWIILTGSFPLSHFPWFCYILECRDTYVHFRRLNKSTLHFFIPNSIPIF